MFGSHKAILHSLIFLLTVGVSVAAGGYLVFRYRNVRAPTHPALPATVQPVPRDHEEWVARHARFLDQAKQGDVNVLFLGDSITQGWEEDGKEVWQEYIAPFKAAGFGIDGDRTQNLLWRITEGKELEGLHPKVVVLLIGTNNIGSANTRLGKLHPGGHPPEEIALGVETILRKVMDRWPDVHVVLMGLFPRGEMPGTEAREKIKAINRLLSRLGDGDRVRFLDCRERFLESDGTLSKTIMHDYLHPTREGYLIWAQALRPVLDEFAKPR
jgi:lysophospholipase L1-like esterase